MFSSATARTRPSRSSSSKESPRSQVGSASVLVTLQVILYKHPMKLIFDLTPLAI